MRERLGVGAVLLGLALVPVGLLSACADASYSDSEENRRFETCINEGGTYKQDGRKWSCENPDGN